MADQKGGNKATAGNHGPSQQSSSDKDAMTYAKKCGPKK